jgi:Tol biopolymer transport system component
VDRPDLLSITFPRFSPDGAWIAFTAAADPGSMPEPALNTRPAAEHRDGPTVSPWKLGQHLPWIGPSPAHAHGVPWDVWIVRPDGTGLQRVTEFQDDDSSVAWSPDGRWLVTLSAEAIHVFALDGSASYCISNEGGYGAIEWHA